jgi:hypothetical protein
MIGLPLSVFIPEMMTEVHEKDGTEINNDRTANTADVMNLFIFSKIFR